MAGCGGCGEANREGAQFCATCGASLSTGCPSCGAIPPSPDSRFCDRCGSPLGAAVAGAQARKVVTVVFADLVGSTAAQETMDPESVRRWLDRYYAVVRSEIEGLGGRVVKFIGDGVMAVFGVPEVREDDADRAVTAARALQAAVTELGGPGGAPGVGMRVGVNTGEVVVTADDDDVVGDVVNVAARLEQAARPGEVLVGEATFRLVRTRAQLRAVAPLELKGKSEPVPAFLLQSLDRTEDDASSSPFVGRAGELERLTAVLEAAIGDRHPQMASVVGTPGVGKSRLVQELGAAAADRARVVVVRCDPAGGATFAPVATALRTAASLEDDASDETVLAGLTALFDEDEPDRQRIAQSAAAVLGVGEPGLPEETFWAVRRLIENAAQRRPLVFVFEDVHWAEPLLLDLIENLATFTKDIPLLIVLTARPELRELRPALVEVGGRVTAAIHLEGLAVDESRRLTRALLDGAALPTALLDRVASASEGNPLFVRELVRMLVDDGVLRQSDGSWTAAVDARTVEVPLSIHAVLAARIDRLPSGEQEVLGAASILGRTFARGAVLDLVDPEVGGLLDEHLEGLRRKELLERAGTYWLDEPQLRFHHALVQDAAYRRLLKEVRADLHERAAGWLQGKVGDLAEHDDLIGFQLEQAHLLRAEAGDDAEALGRAAADRLRTAGRRSLEADDRPGAAALLGRALACLPVADPARAELLLERCEALLSMGDVTEAAPAVAALAALAAGDPRLEGWVACFEGELANLRDPRHLAETTERAERAAASLEALGDHAGAAKAHAVRAASLARLGRIGECERALDQALGSARAAGDRRRATAILAGAPSAALWGPNPVTRASGRCLDVVRVLRITSRAPAVEAISLRCQAVLEALRGRDDAARRMLSSARASLEELGHALGLIEVDLAAGMVETLSGDLDAASSNLERAMEGFHELGIDVDAGLAAALLARVRIAQGATSEALALTQASERLGGDDLKTGIAWRSVRAAALADEGDLVEARRLAEEAVALAEPTDALVDHADALVALAEVLAHQGDEAGSTAAARRAIELYERKEASVPADHARWLLGAEAAVGPHPEAPPPREEAGSARTGPTRSNLAAVAAARVTAAMSPFDAEALEALVVPGLEMWDHRPLVGGGEPSDQMEGFASVHAIGVVEVRIRILGLRGEHLVIIEGEYPMSADDQVDAGTLKTLQVQEVDEQGRWAVHHVYEVEQQSEAWGKLEQLYLEQLDPARAEVWRVGSAMLLAIADRDWEAMAAVMADDVVAVDHRPSGWGTVGRDDFIELYRSSIALAPDARFGFHDVLALTERGVVGEAAGIGNTVDGGEFRTAATAVLEVADGKVNRIAYFPADRVDLALPDLEGSAPAGAAGNAATRLYRDMVTGILGDLEGLRDLVRPDFRYSDHRPVVSAGEGIGFEAAAAWSGALVDLGFQFTEVEVLTLRGDRAGLVRVVRHSDSSEIVALILCALDDQGLGASLDVFEESQLDDALALLDEMAVAQGAAALSNAVTRMYDREVRRVLAGDPDALSEVADDLVSYDHRPLVGVEAVIHGKEVARAWLGGLAEVGFNRSDTEVLAVRGERLGLMVSHRYAGDSKLELLVIAEADEHGIAIRIDVYDPAQLDEATAHLDERHGAIVAATRFAGAGAAAALRNHAVDLFDHARGLSLARDFDRYGDEVHPEIVFADHRQVLGGYSVVGGEAYLDMARATIEMGIVQVRGEAVAVRGDGACLMLVEYSGKTGLVENLTSLAWDGDDRLVTTDIFEIDQLPEAVALLDERFLATLSGDAAETWRPALAFLVALGSRDLGRIEAAITDDYVLHDHRPMGFGDLDRAEYLASFAPAYESSPDIRWFVRQDLGWHENTVFAEIETSGTRDGGSFRTSLLGILHLRAGRLVVLDVFASDDLAATRACFEASASTNAAVRVFERGTELLIAGKVEEAAAFYGPAMVMQDHRPVIGGVQTEGSEDFEPTARVIFDWGFDRWHRTVLAIDGEHLALIQGVFGDGTTEVEVILLAEVDDEDRYVRLDIFDPDQQALAEEVFAERSALRSSARDETADVPPLSNYVTRLYDRAVELVYANGEQELLEIMSPEIQMVDRRPLVGGSTFQGPAAAMEWTASLLEVGFESTDNTALAVRGERLGVVGSLRYGAGSLVETVILVESDASGLGQRMDTFDPSQLPEVIAELEERYLAGEGQDSEAWRRLAAGVAAINRRDVPGLEAVLAAGFAARDHRPLGWGTLDRSQFSGLFPTAFEQRPDVHWTMERDHFVDGDVALCTLTVRGSGTDAGAFENEMLCITVAGDGQMQRIETFPPDHLEAAIARARELAELSATADTAVRRAMLGYAACANAGDSDGLRALFSSSTVMVDHRPLTGGEFRGEELRRALETWKDVGVTRLTWSPFAEHGAQAELVQVLVGGSAAEVDILMLLGVDDAGAIDRLEFFDLEQTADAITRIDDLFAAGDGG